MLKVVVSIAVIVALSWSGRVEGDPTHHPSMPAATTSLVPTLGGGGQEEDVTEIQASIVRIEQGTARARLEIEGHLAPAVGDEVQFWGTYSAMGDRLILVMGTWTVTEVDGAEFSVAPTTPREETASLTRSYRAVARSSRPTRVRANDVRTEPPSRPTRTAPGGASLPQLLRRVEPGYPELARKARQECLVLLEVTVGVDGRVKDSTVKKGCPLGFNEAATAAVSQWEYTPAILDGEPVPFTGEVAVNFELSKR